MHQKKVRKRGFSFSYKFPMYLSVHVGKLLHENEQKLVLAFSVDLQTKCPNLEAKINYKVHAHREG